MSKYMDEDKKPLWPDLANALDALADRPDRVYDTIYKRQGIQMWRGQAVLARTIAAWLRWAPQLQVVQEYPSRHDHVLWTPHVMVECFEDLKAHDEFQGYRDLYKLDLEGRESIPNLTDINQGLNHGMVTREVAHMMACVIPPLVSKNWDCADLVHNDCTNVFNAQWTAVDNTFKRFVAKCYREYYPRYKKQSHRGDAARFGATHLMAWACAGRIMFTFERGPRKTRQQISFVADDSDCTGFRAGPNSPNCTYLEAIAMLDDVVAHWDLDAFKQDDEIGLG